MSNDIQAAMVKAMQEQIAKLEAENAKLKQRGSTFKITPKGGISVYGLGRFPVTLYKTQWEKLLGQAQAIQEFIAANADKLSEKPTAQVETQEDHVA